MSDALEALEKLAQRKEAVIERGDGTIAFPVKTQDEIFPAEFATIRAALEQPSTAEPVAWTSEYSLKHSQSDDASVHLDVVTVKFDDYTVPLYTAPPSTAEAQARALDEMAEEIYQRSLGDDMSESSKDMLCYASGMVRLKAKRIREEG